MSYRQAASGISRSARAAWKFALPVIFLSVFLGGFPVTAPAECRADARAHLQTMAYSVYAGGINAVHAKLSLDLAKANQYRMILSAKTRGFLARLAPWSGSFETEGWKSGAMFRPRLHRSTSVWREETEVKEYSYTRDGNLTGLKITEEGKDKSPGEIEKELTENTTDALTATLLVMQGINENGECEGASEVFDGKRRFLLRFHNKGAAELRQSSYNLYNGPAVVCEVEIEPKGGAWHSRPRGWLSIQEQGRKKGQLPKIWLAKISEEGPAVPVKVQVKTEYGALMAHLTGYETEGGTAGSLEPE